MARRPAVQPGQPPLLHPRRGQPARARASSALPANAASGPWRAANGSQPAWHGGQTQPALAAAAPCAARLPAQRSGVAVGPCRPVRSSRRVDRRSSMCRRPCSHWCSSLEVKLVAYPPPLPCPSLRLPWSASIEPIAVARLHCRAPRTPPYVQSSLPHPWSRTRVRATVVAPPTHRRPAPSPGESEVVSPRAVVSSPCPPLRARVRGSADRGTVPRSSTPSPPLSCSSLPSPSLGQRSCPCAKPRRRRFGVVIAQPAHPRSNPCARRSLFVV
jgi:hypothetical protein